MKKIGVASFIITGRDHILKNLVNCEYTDCISKSGGIPFILPETDDLSLAEEYMSNLDGLLLAGGSDINPLIYNEEPHPTVTEVTIKRDKFELALIDAAVKRNLPIMGICRGMQLLNIYFGGTLIQDIPSEMPKHICHYQDDNNGAELTHSIKVEKNTLLSKALGEKAFVNTYHHQAIRTLAPGMTASAYSPDGLCEAFESKEKKIIATQWHPEKLFAHYENMHEIFKIFLSL